MSTTTTTEAPSVPCPDWCAGGCDYDVDYPGHFSRLHKMRFTVEGLVEGQQHPLVTATVAQCEEVEMGPAGPEVTLHDEPSISFHLGVDEDEWTIDEAREIAGAVVEVLSKATAYLESIVGTAESA
jgi:hypothetical protein